MIMEKIEVVGRVEIQRNNQSWTAPLTTWSFFSQASIYTHRKQSLTLNTPTPNPVCVLMDFTHTWTQARTYPSCTELQVVVLSRCRDCIVPDVEAASIHI